MIFFKYNIVPSRSRLRCHLSIHFSSARVPPPSPVSDFISVSISRVVARRRLRLCIEQLSRPPPFRSTSLSHATTDLSAVSVSTASYVPSSVCRPVQHRRFGLNRR
ncbi:hypothetical protein IC582_023724 [Cucumis melo]